MYGGVAGEDGQPSPLCRLIVGMRNLKQSLSTPRTKKAERVASGYMTIESYCRKRYMYWDLSSQAIPLGPGGRIAIDCYEEEGWRSL